MIGHSLRLARGEQSVIGRAHLGSGKSTVVMAKVHRVYFGQLSVARRPGLALYGTL